MIRTRVGYAGGVSERPTYQAIGDHTETVQIDYDPDRISYQQLLDVFWQNHRPQIRSRSGQYMTVIFYHNEQQHRFAEESKANLEKYIGVVHTGIKPLRSFTLAEEYHQKYYLKSVDELRNELAQIFPDHNDFVNSTAVTRINGYVGGNGNQGQLADEIDRLGLSTDAKKMLIKLVDKK